MKKNILSHNSRSQGFTLVELLVVIAIVAVLAAVVVLVINPVELTKRSRDSVRLSDLATIQQAISVAGQNSTLTPEELYCVGGITAPATFCSGDSISGARDINGTGWVKVDLTQQTTVSIGTLPIDPTNVGNEKYTYKANATGYELDAVMESTQYGAKNTGDGGNDPASYEVGTNINTF